MWRFLIPIVVVAPCVMVAAADEQRPAAKWDFETATPGELPAGWTAAKTGQGEGSVWMIVDDSTSPKGSKVMAQTSKSPGHLFNLCVTNDPLFQDLELSVAFKAVAGTIDQGGGLVWRYLDADNYYVARMNPLEGNFRLYRVESGKRSLIAGKDRVVAPVGVWHTMSVTMKGDQIECSLNGTKILDAKDVAFSNAGKIGFWTKADAQTFFDDLRAVAIR